MTPDLDFDKQEHSSWHSLCCSESSSVVSLVTLSAGAPLHQGADRVALSEALAHTSTSLASGPLAWDHLGIHFFPAGLHFLHYSTVAVICKRYTRTETDQPITSEIFNKNGSKACALIVKQNVQCNYIAVVSIYASSSILTNQGGANKVRFMDP